MGAMAFDDGSYYLYNKAAGQYLEFGSTQGIYAVFGVHGRRVDIATHGDAYVIAPHMLTATYRLDADGCAEGNSTDFTITPTGDGYYTITTDGTNYWGYSESLKSDLISGTLVARDLQGDAGDGTMEGKCDGNAAKGFGMELTFDHTQALPLTIGAESDRWFKADSFTLTYRADKGTGIDPVRTDYKADAPIYDLSGRRVLHPQKGIYIQAGKKFIVK